MSESTERKCENCEWWNRNLGEQVKAWGDCRKKSPSSDPQIRWPKTRINEYCGEFKQRESK